MNDKVPITPEAREAAGAIIGQGYGLEDIALIIARAYQRKEAALKLADELADFCQEIYEGGVCTDDLRKVGEKSRAYQQARKEST